MLENSEEPSTASTKGECEGKRCPSRSAGPDPEGSCRSLSQVGLPQRQPLRQGEVESGRPQPLATSPTEKWSLIHDPLKLG